MFRLRRKPPAVAPPRDVWAELAELSLDLAVGITAWHNDVFHPGRDCDLDADGHCTAIVAKCDDDHRE